MNILPKKRWHVRTRENIARVRRDEAQAAEEEKERQRRALLAEQEARTSALREKARSGLKGDFVEEPVEKVEKSDRPEHVNLFQDIEEGKIVTNKTNAEYEREEKEQKEKYEKQIGYLTYLGQDTVEATGKVSWYNKIPERFANSAESAEVGLKGKSSADPLNALKKYLPHSELTCGRGAKLSTLASPVMAPDRLNFGKGKDGKIGKHRRHKERKRRSFKQNKKCKRRRNRSSDSDASPGRRPSKRRRKSGGEEERTASCSEDDGDDAPERRGVDMARLRAERLRREKEEQLRTQELLARLRGDPPPAAAPPATADPVPAVTRKYNSQFNPELARQNFNHPA
ncbi:leukocyte receptor cluster member 1 [Bacillus rossius redtenbacheri]|uniref:leukocyte receptor cluster member 1 n=1 Tax=Bacillus rossius redtenbacheri TaxID=93214 RepID=UPI002FDD6500